jgi:hypothetical protein
MIDNLLINLSNNKMFIGCILLMTNIGGRYLAIDFPKNIDTIFTNSFILRCVVFFSLFFMATRDIKTSLLLSLLFFIIIHFFVNENSSFCLLKSNKNNKISLEDYNRAKEIIHKYNHDTNK